MLQSEGASALLAEEPLDFKKYEFVGNHLIASYSDCNAAAVQDTEGLAAAMKAAVLATGATLLRTIEHAFPNGGFTMLLLLAESHASIHTYPECNACFVDFFTCGNSCTVENADAVLRNYLQPKKAHCRVVLRNGID